MCDSHYARSFERQRITQAEERYQWPVIIFKANLDSITLAVVTVEPLYIDGHARLWHRRQQHSRSFGDFRVVVCVGGVVAWPPDRQLRRRLGPMHDGLAGEP